MIPGSQLNISSLLSWLSQRFDAGRGIVARVIDEGRHGGHLRHVCRIGLVQGGQSFRIGHLPVEPEGVLFRVELDRSMNNPEKLRCLYQSYPAELMQEWEVCVFRRSRPGELT